MSSDGNAAAVAAGRLSLIHAALTSPEGATPSFGNYEPFSSWSFSHSLPAESSIWQAAVLSTGFAFVWLANSLHLTSRLRRICQPLVVKQVYKGTRAVVAIQRFRHPFLDSIMRASALSVSVEFYTVFLPFLLWGGQPDVGILTAILMALCTYTCNFLKDLVCAPRPFCPPAVRITGSKLEQENSKEYGLPSSHSSNVVALSLYLLYWVRERFHLSPVWVFTIQLALLLFTVVVLFGRMYLGMHSPVDVAAGAFLGALVTAGWITCDAAVMKFLLHGPNVVPVVGAACMFVLLAYPNPESPTPSYADHTAFTGVILGVCISISWRLPQPEELPFSLASLARLAARLAVGLPVLLVCKELGKQLSAAALLWLGPLFGVPAVSRSYFPGPATRGRPGFCQLPEQTDGKECATAGHRCHSMDSQSELSALPSVPSMDSVNSYKGSNSGSTGGDCGGDSKDSWRQGGSCSSTNGRRQRAAGLSQERACCVADSDGRCSSSIPRIPGARCSWKEDKPIGWDADLSIRLMAYAALGIGAGGLVPVILSNMKA